MYFGPYSNLNFSCKLKETLVQNGKLGAIKTITCIIFNTPFWNESPYVPMVKCIGIVKGDVR